MGVFFRYSTTLEMCFQTIYFQYSLISFQYTPVAERREEEHPRVALDKFDAAVRYGPIFACCVCGGAHFMSNVVEKEKVRGLAKAEGQRRFLSQEFLMKNAPLFNQLDSEWCCKTCAGEVDAGRMPALAMRNGLSTTWASLPSSLQSLTQLETEVLARDLVFCLVEGLTSGVYGVGGPDKTLFLLLNQTGARSVREILALHSRPPGHLMQLRMEETLAAHAQLLDNHPRYEEASREVVEDYLQAALEEVAGLDHGLGVVEVLNLGPGQQQELDWFTTMGPKLRTLSSTVLPWSEPFLSAAAKALLQRMPGLEAMVAGWLDVKEEAGVGKEREVALSLQGWIQSRLGHIHRSGPANQPGLLLLLLQLFQSGRLQHAIENGRRIGSPSDTWLRDVSGTKAYMERLQRELAVLRKWLRPACWFITSSQSTATRDLLGTFVSHQAGVEGRRESVWHSVDEWKKLTPREGREEPVEEGYWVHQASEVENDSCPFHPKCARISLEAWRER